MVGHIPESVTLSAAIHAGQKGVEHFGRITKACSSQELAMVLRVGIALKAKDARTAMIAEMATHNKIILDTWDGRLCERILAQIATSGLHVSPTLIVSDFYVGKRPRADAVGDEISRDDGPN